MTDKLDLSRRHLLQTGVAGAGLAAMPGLALAADGATVDTTYGPLKGGMENGVHFFRGIPYGASTAGAGRFMAPRKPARWSGVRDATVYGQRSPQVPGPPMSFTGAEKQPIGEDCLMLSVWTPKPDGAKRPVMVWLHPGGYAIGAGSDYTGNGNLSKKEDVVLVEVNHRLNIFGFLYLAGIAEKYADSGMAGMLDIVAALEWVKDNIAKFGGDPNRVTIFGESGGGGKVSTLMAMPSAKGLFHRAIAQSGFALKQTEPAAAAKSAERVLEVLNLERDQVDELQKLPWERVLKAFEEASTVSSGGTRVGFGPVVDGRSLPRHPWSPDAPPVSADIPFLLGCAKDETTILMGLLGPDPDRMFDLSDAEMRTRLKVVLKADDAAIEKLVATYRKSRPNATPSTLFFDITSDNMMRLPSILQGERKADQKRAPAYVYLFTWPAPVMDGKLGATHGAELPFVFDTTEASPDRVGTGPGLTTLTDQVRGAWAAFARSGDPNHAALPKWTAYNRETRPTMIFDMPSKVVDDWGKEDRLALLQVHPPV